MLQEIYYTSAQRGLKPGSRGFCTVVSTAGMAKNLAERLESLSGYRHVFPPQDARAAQNPLAAMHLRLSIAGRSCHVLSRICDAGLDYTQRTNKFAHHVVLDDSDLPSAGPAWLLAAPGFMQSTWDGEPRTIPTGRRVPAGNCEASVCHHWQRATGDAGWGGVLAETALPQSQRQAVIVFAPGTDVLALVQESLALLPPNLRWGVTFSTYYSKLPPGIECKWRFVVDGSPEAEAARATPQTLLLKLGTPLSPATGGALVEAARTGVVPHLPAARVETPAPAAADTVAAEQVPFEDLDTLLPAAVAEHAARAKSTGQRAGSGQPAYGLGPPPVPVEQSAFGASPPVRRGARTKKNKWPLVVAGLVAVIAIVGVAITAVVVLNGPRPVAKSTQAPKKPVPLGTENPKKTAPPPAEPPKSPSDEIEGRDPNAKQEDLVSAGPQIPIPESPAPSSPPAPAAKSAEAPTGDAPKTSITDAVVPDSDYDFWTINDEKKVSIAVATGHHDLKIVTGSWATEQDLVCVPADASTGRKTNVFMEPRDVPASEKVASRQYVGEFKTFDDHLTFDWAPNVDLAAKSLLVNSRLDIACPNGNPHRVFLRIPTRAEAFQLKNVRQSASKDAIHLCDVDGPPFPHKSLPRVRITLRGDHPNAQSDWTTSAKDETISVIDISDKWRFNLRATLTPATPPTVGTLTFALDADIGSLPQTYKCNRGNTALREYIAKLLIAIQTERKANAAKFETINKPPLGTVNDEVAKTQQKNRKDLKERIDQADADAAVVASLTSAYDKLFGGDSTYAIDYDVYLPLGDSELLFATSRPDRRVQAREARKNQGSADAN